MVSLGAAGPLPGVDQASLVERLVEKLAGRDALPSARLELLGYATRLLSSSAVGSMSLADEGAIQQTVRQELLARGRAEISNKFMELCHALGAKGGMSARTRWAVVVLLRRVAGDRAALASDRPPMGAHLTKAADLGRLQSLLPPSLLRASSSGSGLSSASGVQQPQPGSLQWQQQQQQQRAGGAAYTVSLPPSLNGTLTNGLEGSLRSAQEEPSTSARGQSSGGNRKTGPSSWADHEGALFTIKEPVLVRDVLYACQGVDGRLVKFETDKEAYVLNSLADVPNVERTLVQRMTELGFLFRKVQRCAQQAHAGQGAVHQALCSALQHEVEEFYRLIAVLEQHSNEPIPLPGDLEASGQYLTLRRLYLWLSEPTHKMRVLANLVDSTQRLRGGRLAGAVFAHTQHGNPAVRQYVARVLHAVCVPLFDMIRKWVFEGTLEDPYHEFFVQATSLDPTGPEPDLWREGYSLREEQLPPFLSRALAAKVLRAGKSIHFLQGRCGDARWVQERAAAAQAAAKSAVNFGKVEELERVVREASTQVDGRLIELLQGPRFGFAKHCDAVRKYLLLGQGDFVTALMDGMQRELAADAASISEIQLNHAVRAAIAASNAKYDEDDVLDRLRASKASVAAGGESGWEVFSLQYDINGPLATIFTSAAMSKYARVFQLLWRLKRVESGLAACWVALKCEVERAAARFGKGGAAAEALERRCLRLRSEMSHFATNLQYYIMFEVLEGAWMEFSERVKAASDLDELIEAHEAYLDTLLSKALLDDSSSELRDSLGRLFSNMLALQGLVRRFTDVVRAAEQRLTSYQRRVRERTAAGQWGTVTGEDDIRAIPPEDLAEVSRLLDELGLRHMNALNEFTERLPEKAHDEVRFLLYRLDFSEFYKQRRLAEMETSSGGAAP